MIVVGCLWRIGQKIADAGLTWPFAFQFWAFSIQHSAFGFQFHSI